MDTTPPSTPSEWNYADLLETIAAAVPGRLCQRQGERSQTWGEFSAQADALAADMLTAGATHQGKVAAYLYNGPEYLTTYFAAFKAGLAPVNTNYRYGADEIVYLFDNADAEFVVFHASFAELLDRVRGRLSKVRRWYCVADESGAMPAWATSYEEVVTRQVPGPVRGSWGRSGDDLLLLYTGGTTGMPKGVMWRQDDLFNVLGTGGNAALGVAPITSLAELSSRVAAIPDDLAARMLVACPLMHGTGQFSALVSMAMSGAVFTAPSRQFDAGELWADVARNRVSVIVIVGQAFAGPMLDFLDENPDRYDLSCVAMMTSSGVMWSQDNKNGLLRHLPQAILFDSYGSSEAVGLGGSLSGGGRAEETARFALGPACAVFTDDGRRVEPGSGERGMVAVSGYIPLGYYKDEAKSAQTFRVFDGRRWSIPGDFAEVNADGSLHLLGRGSVCINTGGEKVFPEEIEEALKTHTAVRDAVAVGLPDARFGETICAVVELDAECVESPSLSTLADHVRLTLAAYKAPRHLVIVDTIGRAPNGKVDYKRLTAVAADRLATH